MYCHNCGNPIEYSEFGYCNSCGQSFSTTAMMRLISMQRPKDCMRCGTRNPSHANYCQTCGSSLATLGDKIKKLFKK